uniref:Radish, isoform M n=1 Tax=Drosophila melanogaster TaxID=7227 RepID=X2JBI1_DROME|nr:radish, isoform M [Drosophila melanogaster]AHN59650.1 radish, isoform M [Drosophila melanogaster]|eukprot:NP_001285180.1 radish, isoform M [Drosophila melanogaster]
MSKLRHYRSMDQPCSSTCVVIRKKTMTAICFVCNLPIMSHQVGLVWQGGNGWDDLVREQLEESTIRQRLGGRRDSAAQITTPPSTSPPPGLQRRRRSSLAQLTDILREWSGGTKQQQQHHSQQQQQQLQQASRSKAQLNRRETLADLARSLPWRTSTTTDASTGAGGSGGGGCTTYMAPRKRRESSADSGIRSMRSRRDSNTAEFVRHWNRRESGAVEEQPSVSVPVVVECSKSASRRGSGESYLSSSRRDSNVAGRVTTPPPPGKYQMTKKRDSLAAPEFPNFRQEQRPSTSSAGSCSDHSMPLISTHSSTHHLAHQQVDSACQALPPPTIITSSVTPPATSPTAPKGRRDSQTQCGRVNRRDSKAGVSPERAPRLQRLQRQATAFDEGCLPGGSRRGSQPALSPDPPDDCERRTSRRDSLSPDSASRGGRRDSRTHLSPDRSHERDGSPRRHTLRRQSSSAARSPRSPDSNSCCSSRDPSPCSRPQTQTTVEQNQRPAIRRQSTTEEILIARGFRRQSTTEEMIRCRNFRRQSSQSDDVCRYRGRRDSSAQIIDGTIGTMTVETTSTFFDSSTQTEPSPLYDNNHYHEECLRCNSCGLNLTGPNQKRARRFKNQILCDLHFADVALMECSDFMQQLRSFKPQSLGCAVARRKSSTTLIFPLPPQACSDEFCEEYPHNLMPTPGYWIECSRQKITMPTPHTIWDESDSEHEDIRAGSASDAYLERECSDLYEDDEDSEATPSPRKKTTIEEQWDQQGAFELISVEQETYEKYFYGTEHWNYFTSDEDLGPVILSIKQETLNGRDQFRILVRAGSYTVHGLIPASCVFADRYNREEVVRSLGKEVNLNPPLTLGQLPDTPEELLKLDQVFIKSELKVGVIFVKEDQYTEEQILDNNENSPLFDEFLTLLGDRVRLRGFDKYKGGLDTVHDLTGLFSVYTNWRNIEIMFHVSTLLPYEKHDPQKLQRKRHIGNDIVCVVFLEADNTRFSPACIKSHFLHTFILVRVSARIKHKPTRYEVSVVTRDEVGAYKPYLWEQSVFEKGPMFREWLLTKIVNGERASYSAPKFARMQERTRSQMLEDLVMNLSNHAETGQIPKPYRRGSWRPIGHMRPSSPLLDSVRDQFEDYDQLAKDFTRVFLNEEPSCLTNAHLFDVVFLVGQSKQKARFIGVRAILGVRSRVFQEMLYGIQTGFGSPQIPVAEIFARPAPSLVSPQNQKPKSNNYLTVPDSDSIRPKSVPSSPMVKRAFSRLGTITAGWGRSIRNKNTNQLNPDDKKKWISSTDCSNRDSKDKDKDKPGNNQLAVPRLSVCADAQKVDRAKLAQTEFNIIEFDPDTFRVLLDYLHTGTCPLTCVSIPGLLCAAEHYDLPELLQACFHHCKQFLRIEVVCPMLISLENYYWRYTSASELVNMILSFVESKAHSLFKCPEFLHLSESMVQMIMCRELQTPEIRKFEAMLAWAQHKVGKLKNHPNKDTQFEFECIMERLTRDLNLCRISPSELLTVVLPSKSMKNERIMETLMVQVNLGTYRMPELDAYRQQLRQQESAEATVQVHRAHQNHHNPPPIDARAYAMASLAAALEMQNSSNPLQSNAARDAADEEVELYASFDNAPSTSRVAAQMQAAKEARRKRWAADGASGSSGDGGCASGSSGSGRRY